MSESRKRIDRRSFLAGSAALLGGAAIAPTASSYNRILGANARISLAHIGPGSRGQELAWVVAQHRTRHNVEMTAVCDLWRLHRERAVAENTHYYGRSPRAYQYLEDVLAPQDVDAVIISTPEHSHSPILKMAVEAGKDVYVEKPMGNVLEEAKAAREATKRNKRIVQVGTQHRSEPYPQAARDVVQGGTLGDVSKIEIVWNYHGPRWRGREETKQIREQDTDWRKWLMTKPYRPFDPQVYCEFRLYKEFSSGIPDQWMSHATDLVHWFMNDTFPRSAVAHGGIFAWPDGRENADTFHALLEYPKVFRLAIPQASATTRPASLATWVRRRRSPISAAKEVRAINSPKRRAITRTTRIWTRSGPPSMSCFLVRRSCRQWASMTARWSIWPTGSSACARASSHIAPCRMGSRIRWQT